MDDNPYANITFNGGYNSSIILSVIMEIHHSCQRFSLIDDIKDEDILGIRNIRICIGNNYITKVLNYEATIRCLNGENLHIALTNIGENTASRKLDQCDLHTAKSSKPYFGLNEYGLIDQQLNYWIDKTEIKYKLDNVILP